MVQTAAETAAKFRAFRYSSVRGLKPTQVRTRVPMAPAAARLNISLTTGNAHNTIPTDSPGRGRCAGTCVRKLGRRESENVPVGMAISISADIRHAQYISSVQRRRFGSLPDQDHLTSTFPAGAGAHEARRTGYASGKYSSIVDGIRRRHSSALQKETTHEL